jgi:glutathione S-transferase
VAPPSYAFPRASRNLSTAYPQLVALISKARARPRIAAYLASQPRLDFNESGVFRHYSGLNANSRQKRGYPQAAN